MRRTWQRYHLARPEFAFLLEPPPPNEWVAIDCETTGLNRRTDEIIAIGAVRIVGQRILTSQRLELLVRPDKEVPADSVRIHRLRSRDVAQGLPLDEAMRQLLHFIGSRPLVGYYLEFDVAMLNRAVWPLLGMGLPQQRLEVSAMYYEYKFSAPRLPMRRCRFRSAPAAPGSPRGPWRPALRSSTENSQMPTKPIVIENSAGEVYGNSAEPFGLPSVASHTDGDTTVSATEEIRPRKPPTTAPLVVQSFHSTLMKSTGKLADAAIAKASDTMKAMFCFSKAMPSTTATMPNAMVVMRETLQFGGAVGLALLDHGGVEVVRHRRGAGQRQAGHHRQDGREGHRRDEAQEHVAAHRVGQVDGGHVAAAQQRALGIRNSGLVSTKVMAPKPMMKVRR
jgi:DNA polymerase-3 subunit epsilon